MDNKLQINIIVAIDENLGIAKNLQIPWKISYDMKFFKKTTMNSTVIMGKNTYLSLPKEGLSNRFNIVVSTTLNEINSIGTIAHSNNIIFVKSLSDAITAANKKNQTIFIIGGSKLYQEVLKTLSINKVYLTLILDDYYCDSFFPLSLVKSKSIKKLFEGEVLDTKITNTRKVKIIIYEI